MSTDRDGWKVADPSAATNNAPVPAVSGRSVGTLQSPRHSMIRGIAKRFRVHEWGTVLFFLAFFVLVGVDKGNGFISASNIFTTLADNGHLVFLAVAATITLITGQFDLSLGSTAGLAAVLTAGLTANQHLPIWLAIICVVLVGAIVGAVNGFLVTVVKVNVFIATLGMSGALSGIALIYANGQLIYNGIPASLTNFGRWSPFGNFPVIIVVPVAMALVMWFVSKQTVLGRQLFAVGSNAQSSRLAGVRVERTIVVSLIIAGVLSALGGVVLISRFGSIDPTTGTGFLLPAFAAAFLGSSILSDGRFTIVGAAVATYLVAYAGSGLVALGYAYSGDIFNGVVLVGAVALNEFLRRHHRSSVRSVILR
jgi:ribose transport system permease protein